MHFINGLPIYETIENIIEDLILELRNAESELLAKTKMSSDNLMVTCPVHGDGMERKPSCGVSLTEVKRGNRLIPAGTAHCFTCGFTAELPEFISTVLGYRDKGIMGYKWLSQRYVNIQIDERKPVVFDFGNKEMDFEPVEYVPEWELAEYRNIHPYMYSRGLTDQIIEMFDIGYDPKTDMITFPVHDKDGNCMFVQKRSVVGKRFDNDEGASKETLYGLHLIYRYEDWVKSIGYIAITESPIDTATLWKWGIPACGTMQAIPTAEQLDIIRKLPTSVLIAAQDNDDAGAKGANRLRAKSGKLVKRVLFPEGKKDVNVMTFEEWNNATKSVIF